MPRSTRSMCRCSREFLEKMKATPDGDGSLLDHTVYLYGSGMGNPSLHDHENLPILVAGGAASRPEGRPAYQVRQGHAAGQPPPHAARSRRRPSGFVRRQQRQGRRSLRSRRAVSQSAGDAHALPKNEWTRAPGARPGRRSSGRRTRDARRRRGATRQGARPHAPRDGRRRERRADRRDDRAALGGVSR